MEFEPSLEIEALSTMYRETPMSETTFPQHVSLAMAYVPYQPFEHLYDGETALEKGTFFKALDMPFKGGKDGRR